MAGQIVQGSVSKPIVLDPVEYRFEAVQEFPDGATIVGQPGTKLVVPEGKDGYAFAIRGNNVTLTGIEFVGGGLFLDKATGGYNENIAIDNCVFRTKSKGQFNNCISFTSGLRKSRLSNNLFTSTTGADGKPEYMNAFGVYGYNRDQLVVANNEFIALVGGLHIDGFDPNGADSVFEQNFLSGLKRMGFELQTYGLRTIVQDNWYEKPVMSASFHDNDGTMAFSLIMDRSIGTRILRNTVLAPERPDGVGCRIGFEVGGDDCIVQDNYINGINHSIAANDGNGTTSVLAKNNLILNQLETPRGRGLVLQGENGPNAKLPFDYLNRGRPQRNKRYSTVPVPVPAPVPVPVPAPVPVLVVKTIKSVVVSFMDGTSLVVP